MGRRAQGRPLATREEYTLTPRFRSDLASLLQTFIDDHRGLRAGKMFGRPAGYAGHRLFARLTDDGILLRLPDDIAAAERRKRREPARLLDGITNSWVAYKPKDTAATRRLLPLLELSARHVAQILR